VLDPGKILDGTILSLVFALVVLAAVCFNPRLARRGLPEDIKREVPPLTRRERLRATPFAILFFAAVVGIPLVSALTLSGQQAGEVPLLVLWVHVFGVLFIASLFDLVVLDWLLYCTITPRRLVIPGTEGMAGYKDYRYHLRAHARGTLLMVVVALLLAAVVSRVG
jgi:hypothetical protein